MVLSPYYIDEKFVNDFQSVFTGYNALLGKFAFGLNLNNIKIVFISIFFPPKCLSEGKVVRLTQASIHVIVLGFSSAIITDQDIREEFNYTTVSTTCPFYF